MKKYLTCLAVALTAGMALSAQNVGIQDLPHIDISGHAEAKVQPDRFEITIAFGETKEFFGKQNIEKLEQQIVDVLKKNKIDPKKDVKVTGSYNVAEGKTVFIRKRISFSVDSYAAYYTLAKGLDFKGVESVAVTKTEYSGQEALKSSLRAQALADARRSAEDILAGSGYRTGRILQINAGRAYVQTRIANAPRYNMKAELSMARGVEEDAMESFDQSDEITITFDLQASFEIVAAPAARN